jgi:ArsR family transcriptional regulator
MDRRPAKPKSSGATCGPEEHARRVAKRKLVNHEAFERAASLFRAAGDVERLKVLDRLSDGEWCVTELAEAAGVGLSTVSQQLRILRAEHIVSRRRDGKHIHYALSDRHMIDVIRNVLEHVAESHVSDHEDD